ncbi:MAG: hypothetical protein ABJA16_14130, partial [Nakamurella sp.]
AAAASADLAGTQAPADPAGSDPVGSDPAAASSSTVVVPPVTREIGKTGWYDGFAITVGKVTAEPGYGTDIDVTVAMTYQNLGVENNSPSSGSVELGGLVVDGFFDTPTIPGGAKGAGTVTFSVVPDAPLTPAEAIDQVTLVWGDTSDNQTQIPFADSADVKSQEPQSLALTGTLTQGQIIVDVVSGSFTPSYQSGEKGKALLNVRVKLTCAADCNASGWNTGREEFSVTGPDGNAVVADQRSEYCCDALYPGTVSDSERNVLTFVVPLPGTGDYTLTYDNKNLSSTGIAAPTFTFTV